MFSVACTAVLQKTDVYAAQCNGVETSLIECEDDGKAGSGIFQILKKVLDILTVLIGVAAFAVCGSCSEFPNNCSFVQFALCKNMLNVLADIRFATFIQFNKLGLRQPHGLVLDFDVNMGQPVIRLVYEDFSLLLTHMSVS